MADMKKNSVAKSTMYVAIAMALLVGFLGGVVYTIYNAPAPVPSAPIPANATALQSSRIMELEKATRQHPDNADTWAMLGHAYFDSNQAAQAISAYTASLKLQPDNPDVLTDLGVMYRRNHQPQKAIETFELAIQKDPDHQQARFNQGVVFLNDLHDTAAAIKVWQELLQRNPSVTIPSGAPLSEFIEKIKAQTTAK